VLLDLSPLALAALLGWSGLGKLRSRPAAALGAGTALARLLGGKGRAGRVLRLVGAVETLLAAVLLAWPTWPYGGLGAAGLGTGFLGYLVLARAVTPESSCGCTSRQAPVTWRAFVRAGLVGLGGLAATSAAVPWWTAVAAQPVPAAAVLAVAAASFAPLSADRDRRWPLRRARIRVQGHLPTIMD